MHRGCVRCDAEFTCDAKQCVDWTRAHVRSLATRHVRSSKLLSGTLLYLIGHQVEQR
jgi:hypothetical protein